MPLERTHASILRGAKHAEPSHLFNSITQNIIIIIIVVVVMILIISERPPQSSEYFNGIIQCLIRLVILLVTFTVQ